MGRVKYRFPSEADDITNPLDISVSSAVGLNCGIVMLGPKVESAASIRRMSGHRNPTLRPLGTGESLAIGAATVTILTDALTTQGRCGVAMAPVHSLAVVPLSLSYQLKKNGHDETISFFTIDAPVGFADFWRSVGRPVPTPAAPVQANEQHHKLPSDFEATAMELGVMVAPL